MSDVDKTLEFTLEDFVKETKTARGADGKFARATADDKPTKPDGDDGLRKAPGEKGDDEQAEPLKAEDKPEEKADAKADDKPAEKKPDEHAAARKAEVLAAKLEAQREARVEKTRAEAARAEAEKARSEAIEVHQKLERMQADFAKRVQAFEALARESPTQFLAEAGIDPRAFLDALAHEAGQGTIPRPRHRAPEPHPLEASFATLQQRIERLEAEKAQAEASAQAARAERDREQAMAALTKSATDTAAYPSITAYLDAEDVPDAIVAEVRRMEAEQIPLDDDVLLDRLEKRCKARLDRREPAVAAAKISGASPSDQATRHESSVTARVTAQRVSPTKQRSQAERWKDLEDGKFEIADH